MTEPVPSAPPSMFPDSGHAGAAGEGGDVPADVPGERLGVPYGASRQPAPAGRSGASYVFLAVLSILAIVADVVTKAWAASHLDTYPGVVEVIPKYVTLVLAKNRGGAWGLLQTTSENVRRPFFLLVSVVAILFIMALYRRVQPRQRALRWGLPLVFGGAIGNVLDRIRYGHVIDFIDVHVTIRGVEHHWPTFNVADIAICIGVGLMAVDMFASKRGRPPLVYGPHAPPAQAGEPVPRWKAPADGSDPSDPAAAP